MIEKFIQKRFLKIIAQMNAYNRHSQHKLYQSFKNKHEQKLIVIFLYFSLIDILKNIETLLKNENPVAISILVRSAIDLIILMKIANKDINKILSHYKYQITLDIKSIATELSENERKKLSKPELIEIALLINAYTDKYKELNNVNKKKMLEAEKRKFADISDELEELYKSLSEHVHHGYDALVQRHGIIKKNTYNASSSKQIPNALIYTWLHGLLLCLTLSIIELFKCIGLPSNHNLKLLYTEIHDLDAILKKRINKSYIPHH